MQIGLMFEGQNGLNWDNWKQILEIADNSGYNCVFRSDHFTNTEGDIKDALELFTSLTYAATVTKNIEFGPLVTPHHVPASSIYCPNMALQSTCWVRGV